MANLQTEVTRIQSTPNFPKNERFLALIRTRTCTYKGVKNVRFSENLASFDSCYFRFEIRPFAILPTLWSARKVVLSSFFILQNASHDQKFLIFNGTFLC